MEETIIVLLALLIIAAVGFVSSSVMGEVEVVETKEVTVAPGDTLWGFINTIEGREKYDGHQIISLVRAMNDLDCVSLSPGQTIIIPEEVK